MSEGKPVTEPMPKEKRAEVTVEQLKMRVEELAYAKEQLEHRIIDLIMTRAKNALVALTDAEREAIESAIWDYEQNDDDEDCARMVSTLRGLLERTK